MRWLIAGGLTLVAVLIVAWFAVPKTGPEPVEVTAITGEKFTILRETVRRLDEIGDAYCVTIYTPAGMSDAEVATLEETTFVRRFGFLAEQYGFKAVVISHSADIEKFRMRSWLPLHITIRAHADEAAPMIFRQGDDGAWTRDGVGHPAVDYIADYTLPSGAHFGLSEMILDQPKGLLVYDCLSCGLRPNIHETARSLEPLITNIALAEADRQGVRNLDVVVATGRRQGEWRFPFVFKVHIDKKGNDWVSHTLDAKTWDAVGIGTLNEYRRKGEAARAQIAAQRGAPSVSVSWHWGTSKPGSD